MQQNHQLGKRKPSQVLPVDSQVQQVMCMQCYQTIALVDIQKHYQNGCPSLYPIEEVHSRVFI